MKFIDRTGKSAFIDVIDLCTSIQTDVDFEKVKEAGFRGVIVKSSQYSSTKFHGFDSYVTKARAAGLAVGAYHFCSCDSDPVAQAEFFLRASDGVGLKPGDIPHMMDLEYASQTLSQKGPAYVVDWGVVFMGRLAKEYHGLSKMPFWYTFPNFAAQLQPWLSKSELSAYSLNLARYRANNGPEAAWYPPDDWRPDLVPAGCPKPFMAQYSGNGGIPVPGIRQITDRNVFFGSLGDWDKFRGIIRPAANEVFDDL